MRIAKYIHSCLVVEERSQRLLLDPGKFTFLDGQITAESLGSFSAVVITHQHPDHVDVDALRAILQRNGEAVVVTNGAVRDHLAQASIMAEVLEEGRREIGGFRLQATPAQHAQILNAKAPQNTAYVINESVLHPGDSFDHSLDVFKGIGLLALPVMAPWNTELQVAEFAVRLAPKKAIPIHDGYAKEFFLDMRYDNFKKYFAEQGIEFVGLKKPGDGVEI